MSSGSIFPTQMYGAAPGATLAPASIIPSNMFAAEVKDRTNDKGNHVLENMRIFKVGTFTDMFGYEHTWEEVHLDLMVMHYKLLRDGGYFPNVPIRADHSFSVNSVVGYFEDIYRDPSDPQFLSASIEFTEPDAYEKWQRGTWRSRSIEIGMYETNDNKSFWPVVMGLAFVDIPAVEGLHGRQRSVGFSQAIMDNEEGSMPPDINTDPEGWTNAVNYAAWVQAANYAKALEDWERAVVYAKALEDEAARQNQPQPQPGITPHASPTPPTPPPTPTPPTPPPSAAPLMFRVNGQQTADFSTVQSHIDMLESFRAETVKSGRTDFVEGLAKDNKIAATQIESLTAHALSLTDEQFASFRATYEAAPSLTLFGQQAQQGTQPPNTGTTTTNAQDDPEVLLEIVAQHKRAGMSKDKIEKTDSYKKLVALDKAPSL